MATAHSMDVSTTSDIMTHAVVSLQSAVDEWADNFVGKNSTVAHNIFYGMSGCSVIERGFADTTECMLESNAIGLLSDRWQSDNVTADTSCRVPLPVTVPYCWNSTSTGHMTSYTSSSFPTSSPLLMSYVSHCQSMSAIGSDLHRVCDETVMKDTVAIEDCSVFTGITADMMTAVGSYTRPLFDCDYNDDDDDCSVDRLIIDIKEEDAETACDELQSTASSVENNVCDNNLLPKESLGTCENIKCDASELNMAQNCDGNSKPCGHNDKEKPLTEADMVEMERPTNIDMPKTADMLTDKMFALWPAVSCRVGAGLQNLGNTCFVNATVQCLTYTVPLVNYLLTFSHSASCKFSLMLLLNAHCTETLFSAIKNL